MRGKEDGRGKEKENSLNHHDRYTGLISQIKDKHTM